MTTWELWLADDAGNRLELLNSVTSFELGHVVGDVGWASLLMPHAAGTLYTQMQPDRQIQMYRQPRDGTGMLELEALLFQRRLRQATSLSGLATYGLGGADANDLLARRIVAYAAGSAQAEMSDQADDMMKEIVRDALGGDAGAGRDMTAVGFSVGANAGAGPTISKAFAWQNVLSAAQGVQAASRAAGSEVFFAVQPTSLTSYRFDTYTGQPGRDRRWSVSPIGMMFGLDWGNVANVVYEQDYTDEENYIYAGGRGQGAAREVQEVSDAGRIAASRWNRREGFAPSNATTAEGVRNDGRERLERQRPRLLLSADLLDTPATPYGAAGWRVGDRVTVTHLGRSFDCLIRSAYISVDAQGQETVRARVENIA
jgi:hypothetical protein